VDHPPAQYAFGDERGRFSDPPRRDEGRLPDQLGPRRVPIVQKPQRERPRRLAGISASWQASYTAPTSTEVHGRSTIPAPCKVGCWPAMTRGSAVELLGRFGNPVEQLAVECRAFAADVVDRQAQHAVEAHLAGAPLAVPRT
jgi:hypothetical protein